MKPEPIPPPVLDWAFLRRQVVEAQAALGIQAERQGGVSRNTRRVTCGWLEILEAVARRLLLIAATPLFWKLDNLLKAKKARLAAQAEEAAPQPVEEETQTEARDEAPPEDSPPAPETPKPKRPAFQYLAQRPHHPRDPNAPVRPFELWEWRPFVSKEALDRRFTALLAVLDDPAPYVRGMARLLLKNHDQTFAAVVYMAKRSPYRKKGSSPGVRYWFMLEEADFMLMSPQMKRPADTS